LAHSLYDIASLQPWIEQGCAILTPNLRLSRRIASEWNAAMAAGGARVWEPLAVSPLEEWLLRRWEECQRDGLLPPAVLLSRQQELWLWRQAIDAHAREAQVPALLHPAGAAEWASEARELLLRHDVDPAAARQRQLFGMEPDCAVFLAWLERFQRSLERAGACTRGDAFAALAGLSGHAPAAAVALVACSDLEPVLQAALQTSAAAVHTVPSPARDATCAAYAFADARGELEAVAGWASRLVRGSPGTTVGIVLSSENTERVALEYFLRREFDCLGENYNSLPVNFSAGMSLARTPLVRDALAVLSLGLDKVAVASVIALLRSRFLDLRDGGGELAVELVQRLHAAGVEEVSQGALRNLAGALGSPEGAGLRLGELLLAMSGMRELRDRAPPSTWLQRFNALLDLWGWPGTGTLDSLEYQQVSHWQQTQDEFRALDLVAAALDYPQALQLLREACEARVSHPQTADSPVQVLGPLEAVGLAFDHLWVCGMQASRWPSPPRPNPFIPVALQAAHAMPHATPERERAFSQRLLDQYRGACGHVHASYSRQIDGVQDLPSTLLESFEDAAAPALAPLYPPWREQQETARWQSLDDRRGPSVAEVELAQLRGGSAIIADQSNCAFRAFARRRLRVEPLPDFVSGIAPQERGNIVHRALEVLWQEVGARDRLPRPGEPLRELVTRAVERGLERLPDHRRIALGVSCVDLERRCLQQLLEEWLEVERERGEAFTVAATEDKLEVSLGTLPLSLRVDRVDELSGGGRMIIDYKTGKCAVGDWVGERPKEPQLLLYLLASGQAPTALAFAQVRPGDCAYVGLGESGSVPGVRTDVARVVGEKMAAQDWPALRDEWRRVLERLAEDFLDGEAAVDPLRGACTFCGLQALCRVGYTTADTAGESA